MHTASRLASHRSFKLIVRFPGTDDPDVPVINVAQLQTHTQEEVSSSTSTPIPRKKPWAPIKGSHFLTHNQHGYNYTQVVCFEQGTQSQTPFSIWRPSLTSTSNLTLTKTPRTKSSATAQKRTCSEHTFSADSQSHTPEWNRTSSHDNNYNGPSNTYSNDGHCLELWLPT